MSLTGSLVVQSLAAAIVCSGRTCDAPRWPTNFMGLLVLSLSHMCGGAEMMVDSIVVGELVAPLGAHDGSSSIVLDGEIEDSTLSTALAMVPAVQTTTASDGARSDGSPQHVSRRGRVFSGPCGYPEISEDVVVGAVFLIT